MSLPEYPTIAEWDLPEDRIYTQGLDRGMLYFPQEEGVDYGLPNTYSWTGVPWNGLISVVESSDKKAKPVYFDGMKVGDVVDTSHAFKGVITALTFPDEFSQYDGGLEMDNGSIISQQKPKIFHLAYRSFVGNALAPLTDYKLHVLFNLTATPINKTYESITGTPKGSEFQWEITSVPVEPVESEASRELLDLDPDASMIGLELDLPPTSHLILDTRVVDERLIWQFEISLYGIYIENVITLPPSLAPPEGTAGWVTQWCILEITDNGDGTWTASDYFVDGLGATIVEPGATDQDPVTLYDTNHIFLDDPTNETFEISSTSRVDQIT